MVLGLKISGSFLKVAKLSFYIFLNTLSNS